ncbi:MAG TPA: AMP-binding protein [Polyangiales bacterium]|nr:AMP-binding protein [Polyangiales bacterium]
MPLLHELLFRTADQHADRIAVRGQTEVVSFGQFASRVQHLAGALESLGLLPGDRVSLLAQNRTDYLTYHYATSLLGVILHVMNTRHVLREWAWAIRDAASSALIVDAPHAVAAAALARECPSLRFVIGIGEVTGADFATDSLVSASKSVRHAPVISPDQPVLLIYTSGTTGLPKGCLQTQLGSTTIDALTADAMDASERDVYMAIMPYFHQAGMIRSRAVMLRGGSNVVPEGLSMDAIADQMTEQRVSITMLVSGQQALTLLDKAANQGRDFSALRLLISGGGMGAKVMPLLKLLCDTLKCEFMGIWGQTECTGPVTVVKGDVAFSNPTTCGKPMPGIDLEIWADDGTRLPVGESGEIMVRSPMTASYFRNPEANAALYSGEWLHTGDLGRLDADGYLYFLDRKKDLIKTGGENVYPREVEVVLQQHPAIAELTVIGLPDPRWGQAVTAVIVLNTGHQLSLEDVRAFCSDKIAGYKIPKAIELVDTIPKNETGKVVKRELRERFAKASENL